ncbi:MULTISPECIES: cupin domain-containing protein [unclassified Chelatococcus]|uniref:cupin domain-containing protein n=1 Tax=unclassified Chelatococcus TaxID=2638111 RepID=UPI001BCB6CF7|nr:MULTISPECIES: cupin domain-containing protein [unclassified Chelatococcus]CAH1658727.1 Oxalate decarboxylase OxdD [Hyphomicrobiales bacterium]MBS7740835.1 cupin domain-containing protein [Chelatococcus sp. HY11]MBX3545931.1 cupin domain-containing protein [Chelatococcus sp.]MCO5079555.1 cupin domain-containing protein [Chelatococcus sp.]CAH1684054.1 Oxalate decarboxylase OxdD [Hyphomicrobiales bacterium]
MSTHPISFRYRLEQEEPRLGPGGITRGASVKQFPASQGIAGVSMRLEPGGMRELHWHANAAEWAYVISGNCRTTLLNPDGGAEIDTFGPGDVWYFPRGWGHSIQGIGPDECHFILIFDNGDFSEDHTFSITDWLSRTPQDVVAASLGLAPADVALLPKGEAYFAKGPTPDDRSADATCRKEAQLVTTHRYPLHAQQPRRVPGGGTQRTVTVDEFPISRTMAGSLLEIQPGAMRELHWHPNADEWQYYIEGRAEMAVFLAEGNVVTEQFEAGDVGYAPMGSGHYIKNTGQSVLRVLVGFNNGHYQANDLSAWLSTNPVDVLATNLGLPREKVASLPRRQEFFVKSSS